MNRRKLTWNFSNYIPKGCIFGEDFSTNILLDDLESNAFLYHAFVGVFSSSEQILHSRISKSHYLKAVRDEKDNARKFNCKWMDKRQSGRTKCVLNSINESVINKTLFFCWISSSKYTLLEYNCWKIIFHLHVIF